ncbi:tryptophan--tRNA ligase [Candidatus Saccharibacteria bacterium]|nr:tryptophan--tRNA ligase [Candidatus Saccharibacteria bacterium]
MSGRGRQSYIPAHSELTWILDCFTGFGEMNRMTQFKDRSTKLGDDRVSVGVFIYPLLMAADILLYGAKYIPVGDDQSQHLEFTRDIAERLNNQFGNLFMMPEPVPKQHEFFGKDQGLRIKDLVDPTKKMSKSDDSGKGIIFMGDNPEEAASKIMSATTDSEATVGNPDMASRPGVTNLLQILKLLKPDTADVSHMNYSEFKGVVAEAVKEFLNDFQSKLSQVDEAAISAKLADDEAKMAETAGKTLYKVQQAVGLRPSDVK